MRVIHPASVVGLCIALLACAKPPPPEDSNSSGLAVHLDVRAPLAVLPIRVEQVLFVRLEETEEDSVLSINVFYSNYSDDGYYYLLNPPPGRYVAVAAVSTTGGIPNADPNPDSSWSPPPGWPDEAQPSRPMEWSPTFDIAVYFREELVRQTEVTTRPGSLSFMGEFLVHTSPLQEPDPVQAHYFRLLQPGQSENLLVQTLYHDRGIYGGRVQTAERGDAARDRFSHKASEHLMSAGWGRMLRGVSEGPTQ